MEELLGLAHFAPLEMADFDRQPLDRPGDHCERAEEHRVAVARDHLRRHRLDREAELLGNMGFDVGMQVREGADGPADGADRDLRPRGLQAVAAAGEFGEMAGELHAEGGRLGVDAVAAADGQRVLVLEGAPFQREQHRIQVVQQQVRRLRQLHRERRIEHVAARHPLVHEPARGADGLGEPGQEGDDVMTRFALDRLDTGDVLGADAGDADAPPLADRSGGFRRDHPEPGHRLGGERFDLEPDPVTIFGRPDGRHLRPGVARNHCGLNTLRSGQGLLDRNAVDGKIS